MANGNLADALRVARAAVEQRPNDIVWRERLAQVAEFSSKPAEALEQWRYLAIRTGSEKAFQAILRIAPGLNDDEALLLAWRRTAEQQPAGANLGAKDWRTIAELFERVGRPAEGVAFLEARHAASGDPAILDTLAWLEERMGRVDQAIRAYERLIAASGATAERAVKLATLYFLRADFSRAFRLLDSLKDKVPADAVEYWKMLAELAWDLQEDDAARTAYGKLAARDKPEPADLDRLVQLLRPRQPEEAVRLAEMAWRRFRSVPSLLLALEYHSERRDSRALKRLFEDIGPADEARLRGNSLFYVLRASYYQSVRQIPLAQADYRRALAIAPESTEVRISYLWFLIDAKLLEDLRRQLRAWTVEANRNSAWWDVVAAGYTAIGNPRIALSFMGRQANAKSGDYLWLAGYADVLEEAGQGGMAWRVRRRLAPSGESRGRPANRAN